MHRIAAVTAQQLVFWGSQLCQ